VELQRFSPTVSSDWRCGAIASGILRASYLTRAKLTSKRPEVPFRESKTWHRQKIKTKNQTRQSLKNCLPLAKVASAGTHIFLAAEKADRFCLPNTRFLIHQPSGGAGGSASDIAIQAEQIVKMRERLAQVISSRTGTDIDRVRLDIERDKWMDTDEAIEYGLVSKVVQSSREIV